MRALRRFLLLGLVALLAACGFHVRGAYDFPFPTLFITQSSHGAVNTQIYSRIKQGVESASSKTHVVNDPKEAAANLIVISDTKEKNILSLSSAGRVLEYELVRRFKFKIDARDGGYYIAPTQISIRREMTYNDTLVLSKGSEEDLLWRDIENDLVTQVLRRMSAATLHPRDDDADTF
jgi:LPS-assembly lipoprotein